MNAPTGTEAGLQEIIDAFLQGKLTSSKPPSSDIVKVRQD